jgi:hypothetical protein
MSYEVPHYAVSPTSCHFISLRSKYSSRQLTYLKLSFEISFRAPQIPILRLFLREQDVRSVKPTTHSHVMSVLSVYEARAISKYMFKARCLKTGTNVLLTLIQRVI